MSSRDQFESEDSGDAEMDVGEEGAFGLERGRFANRLGGRRVATNGFVGLGCAFPVEAWLSFETLPVGTHKGHPCKGRARQELGKRSIWSRGLPGVARCRGLVWLLLGSGRGRRDGGVGKE